MATKQELTRTEARILVYISQVPPRLRFGAAIASKLDMDYAYALMNLSRMKSKGWLYTTCPIKKKYWFITEMAPLENSKRLLNGECDKIHTIQDTLIKDYTEE